MTWISRLLRACAWAGGLERQRKNHAAATVRRAARWRLCSGKVERADGLRMVYFDQNRQLDPEVTLRRRWRRIAIP